MEPVVYGVIKEEKERNLESQQIYLKEIESLPKGTIVLKMSTGTNTTT